MLEIIEKTEDILGIQTWQALIYLFATIILFFCNIILIWQQYKNMKQIKRELTTPLDTAFQNLCRIARLRDRMDEVSPDLFRDTEYSGIIEILGQIRGAADAGRQVLYTFAINYLKITLNERVMRDIIRHDISCTAGSFDTT